jgi:hypothetical protein
MGLDPAPEGLGPQAPVDLPFVKIRPFLPKHGRLDHQRKDIAAAEGDVLELGLGAAVRIRG